MNLVEFVKENAFVNEEDDIVINGLMIHNEQELKMSIEDGKIVFENHGLFYSIYMDDVEEIEIVRRDLRGRISHTNIYQRKIYIKDNENDEYYNLNKMNTRIDMNGDKIIDMWG